MPERSGAPTAARGSEKPASGSAACRRRCGDLSFDMGPRRGGWGLIGAQRSGQIQSQVIPLLSGFMARITGAVASTAISSTGSSPHAIWPASGPGPHIPDRAPFGISRCGRNVRGGRARASAPDGGGARAPAGGEGGGGDRPRWGWGAKAGHPGGRGSLSPSGKRLRGMAGALATEPTLLL